MKKFRSLYMLPLALISIGATYLGAVSPNNNNSCECECIATGKSTFVTRGFYDKSSPERVSISRDRLEAREDGWGGFIEATVFGGQSSKSGRLAQYFFPECKKQLTVNEQVSAIDTEYESTTDILANHFNIYTVDGNFESTITIRPKESFIGAGFTWKQELCSTKHGYNFWGMISLPIVHLKHTMDLKEDVINDGGGANPAYAEYNVVSNMIEAFNQAAFTCGRINSCCKMEKTRLADVEIDLGIETVNCETCFLESFVGLVIPTGNHHDPKYVFSPVVGNFRHFGFIWGSSAAMQLWHHETCDRTLWGYLDVNSQYLLKHCEKRLLDVKGKTWSRYMQVYVDEAQAQQAADACNEESASFNQATCLVLHTPGVQIFCQNVEVHPRFSFTINTALGYRVNNWELEGGYNYFSRKAECLKLKKGSFNETSAFKSLLGQGRTNDVQTICRVFGNVNDTAISCPSNLNACGYAQNIITAADLDLQSAAAPSMFMHTLYGALSYHCDEREYPVFAGIGGSYEFSSDNTGMERWMLWGKAGISF